MHHIVVVAIITVLASVTVAVADLFTGSFEDILDILLIFLVILSLYVVHLT